MTRNAEFTTFVALIEVTDRDVQNTQELASVWGGVGEEFDEVGARITDAYATLGEFDFVVVFEAEGTETAFQSEVVLERHGLDVRTVEAMDTDEFAAVVTDH